MEALPRLAPGIRAQDQLALHAYKTTWLTRRRNVGGHFIRKPYGEFVGRKRSGIECVWPGVLVGPSTLQIVRNDRTDTRIVLFYTRVRHAYVADVGPVLTIVAFRTS